MRHALYIYIDNYIEWGTNNKKKIEKYKVVID